MSANRLREEKLYVQNVGKINERQPSFKDTVVCISDYSLSRTQMVFDSLDSICYEFDLENPSGWTLL